MAKFCQNCGLPLTEEAKFCAECGAPIVSSAALVQSQKNQQSETRQAQRQYTPKSQVYIPEGYAKKNAERVQQEKTSLKKKNGKRNLVILLAAVIGLVSFFGFRDGGWFRRSNSYDAQHIQSLLVYAQQLEKNGNSEASAAVYELIAKGGGAELVQKAYMDNSVIKKTDEVKQIEKIFDNTKGGSGK